jgi:uncharacterized membrane protein YhaH (DUF805 family)
MTDPQAPLEIGYESAVTEPMGRRPKWVWVVIVIYLLAIAFVMLLPLWAKISSPDDNEPMIAMTITSGLTAICGLGLVFTPVQLGRRRLITRGNIWIPLLASGFLLGALFVGGAFALFECLKLDEKWIAPICVGGGLVWIGWAVVLWLMTSSRDPKSIAVWLNRTVFTGSVAELLVAVPCHVIVRRRGECCGGMFTGMGICIGCVAMILSFGPGVAFLYYRRWKQITRKT